MKKDLETKLKDLKIDLNNYNKFQKYNKSEFEEIMKNLYMVWRGRKIHKILFKFREESSSSANSKIHLF